MSSYNFSPCDVFPPSPFPLSSLPMRSALPRRSHQMIEKWGEDDEEKIGSFKKPDRECEGHVDAVLRKQRGYYNNV